jgi:ankyrin repeat protein
MSKARKAFNRTTATHNVPEDEGRAFLEAAKKGDLPAVTAFVEKYGKPAIDLRDRDWSPPNEPLWKTDQKTALIEASWEKHKDVVEYLLSAGADVNASDKYGYTPLMVSHEPIMAGLLLDAGAKIDQRDNNGGSALMWPSTAEMIKFLVSRGANIETRDDKGKTALMRVAEGHYARGHATLNGNLTALLECGADINARDNQGRTALMCAAARAAFSEEAYATVEFLLKHNANPHLKDKQGNTAADHALGALQAPAPGDSDDLDVERLAMENADTKTQARIAKLVTRMAAEDHARTDKAFKQGLNHKVTLLPTVRLKPKNG